MRKFIRIIVLSQVFAFIFNGIYYAINNNAERYFRCWALGLILLAGYGIMIHIEGINERKDSK